MSPTNPRSTVLTTAEEALVIEFQRRTLLPLDEVLGCLRDSIPNLTRSSLHRCLARHGISRLLKSLDELGPLAPELIGDMAPSINRLSGRPRKAFGWRVC